MNNTSINRYAKFSNKGFSLVEMIVVVAIIVILVSISVPSFICGIARCKKEVCNVNCWQLEEMYHIYLNSKDIEHNDSVFIKYMQEHGENICPNHGDIIYLDGKIQCSLHPRSDNDEYSDEDLPFL